MTTGPIDNETEIAMNRTIAGALTIAALLAGCGGSDEPSLNQGREAWLELDGAEKEELTRTCRARAAADVGEMADSARTRQRIESVDLDALIGRIDQWYAQERPNPGPISEVCFAEAQDLSVTEIQSEIEELQGP